MIAKLKSLDQYINHGVWGFFLANETYPIKRKILELTLNFDGGEPQIYRVKIEEFGWKDSSEVFMSRKEALQYQYSKLKQIIRKKREVIKFKKKEIELIQGLIEQYELDIRKIEEKFSPVQFIEETPD